MDVPSLSRSGFKGPVASAVAGDVGASAAADVVVSTVMVVVTVVAMVATAVATAATAVVTTDTAAETHTVAAAVVAAGDATVAVTTATLVAMAAGRTLTKVSTSNGGDGWLSRPVRVMIDELSKD